MNFSAAGQSPVACLSDQQLSDFVSGRLSDPATEEQLAEHLSLCADCSSRLESLPGDPLLELLCAKDPLLPPLESGGTHLDHSLQSTATLQQGDSKRIEGREPNARHAREELPVKIGDYFVIRKLGRGGFGDVYLALDPLQDRHVAIKVPRPDRFSSRDSREAFLKEARTIAELNHPHIVRLYDCCELADGRCIVVMEYIEGTTLKEWMHSERIDRERAIEIIAQIADALDYAHQKDIWHRDVKPANILLNQEGQPFLTDFGLAIHEEQQHQLGEELAGTYPYMSPEQVLGRARHLDGRSDIWSLGVTLYELLTRHRPFQGSTHEQIAEEIANRAPQAPRFHDPTIPRHIELACLKCLESDPADRFATAAELARQLRRQMGRTSRRRWALGLSAAAVVAAAGVASWKLLVPGQNRPPRPVELKLTPLAWPTLVSTDFCRLTEKSGVAFKSSAMRGCFETHRPRSSHYNFHGSGELLEDDVIAGLAVGIHETAQTPRQHSLMVVCVSRDFSINRLTWLSVETAKIVYQGGRMVWRPGLAIARAQVDDRLLNSFQLEVQVRGRIAGVRYNHRPLPQITEKLADYKIARGTSCGIMAMGHIEFHHLSCEEFEHG